MGATPEEANRAVLADAIANWAYDHCYLVEDIIGIDAAGRTAVARLARRAHPVLNERWGHVPSDATWDLAMRLLSIREDGGTVPAPEPEDPFRGFPQH